MPVLNLKQVKAIEDDISAFQRMEIGIKKDNKRMKKIMKKYAVSSLYSDAKKLEKMIAEVDTMIEGLALTAAQKGKMMSLSTIENYLDKAEVKMKKMVSFDEIARANSKKELQRIDLYLMEAAKEKGILQADIEIYKATAKLAGKSEKAILKDLVSTNDNDKGPLVAYEERMKKLQVSVLRREEQAAEMDEYRKYQVPEQQWQWIAISVNPCPDCRIRAGVVLTWGQWEDRGLPGSGRTICRDNCLCKLYPAMIADEMFPEVKQFKWDKTSGVLSTAMDERVFGAKSNQPDNVKK